MNECFLLNNCKQWNLRLLHVISMFQSNQMEPVSMNSFSLSVSQAKLILQFIVYKVCGWGVNFYFLFIRLAPVWIATEAIHFMCQPTQHTLIKFTIFTTTLASGCFVLHDIYSARNNHRKLVGHLFKVGTLL